MLRLTSLEEVVQNQLLYKRGLKRPSRLAFVSPTHRNLRVVKKPAKTRDVTRISTGEPPKVSSSFVKLVSLASDGTHSAAVI